MTVELVEVFANDSRSVGQARDATSAFLADHGEVDDLLARLLVSEVMTNGVTHGAGPIELRLAVDDERERLRVVVTDRGGGRPVLHTPEPDDAGRGGWGLRLVDDSATAWGSRVGRGRTTVWFELPARRVEHAGAG